jgi:hypothetical protein
VENGICKIMHTLDMDFGGEMLLFHLNMKRRGDDLFSMCVGLARIKMLIGFLPSFTWSGGS